jgi:hypothetical protein
MDLVLPIAGTNCSLECARKVMGSTLQTWLVSRARSLIAQTKRRQSWRPRARVPLWVHLSRGTRQYFVGSAACLTLTQHFRKTGVICSAPQSPMPNPVPEVQLRAPMRIYLFLSECYSSCISSVVSFSSVFKENCSRPDASPLCRFREALTHWST